MRVILTIALILLSSCSKKAEKSEALTATETMVKGEAVDYSANGTTLKGYVAYDSNKSGKRPGVIVVHEWWGHNAYARKRADMLAEMGYVALALDMYGDGKTADHPDNAGKFAGEVMSNMNEAKARFTAAMETLKANPNCNGEIAAIGYCFGGGVVLNMARMGLDLKGVASFHGSYGTQNPAKAGDIKGAVLICHGADDPFAPAETVTAIKKEFDEAKVDYKFIAYEGAKHSFTNPDADENGKKFNLPLEYNKSADEKSWQELTQFLKKIF